MGWFIEGSEGHEGYVANVLGDGRAASATTGGGVVLFEVTPADEAAGWVRQLPYGQEAVVPWSEVTTWRVMCECGWTGSSRPAEDTEGFRDCPPAIEEEFAQEWQSHVRPFTGLASISRLSEQARELAWQLDDEVAASRARGATWEAIGKAAGLTKQGAQQRWG